MEKLTNIQLKIILRSWNLKVTRNKKDLIERLENDLVENRIDPEEYIKQYIDDDSSEIQPGDSASNISARTCQSKKNFKQYKKFNIWKTETAEFAALKTRAKFLQEKQRLEIERMWQQQEQDMKEERLNMLLHYEFSYDPHAESTDS